MNVFGSTSVVIPVYNGARYLAEAIESAKRQASTPCEIIVVDDGSTDATPEIAAKTAGIVYARQDHKGPAAALNHGARLASGAFISFLSADDLWCPDKLLLQHRALGGEPEGKLVFGHMKHFVSPDVTAAAAAKLNCPPAPMAAFAAGTLLATLATFRSVGAFDERFTVGEFMDWYGRAVDLGLDIIMLPETVTLRRVHDANYSTAKLRTETYAPVLKTLLDRRRGRR
jgi:glycosyltransferase involved in cell wall biosynthesis